MTVHYRSNELIIDTDAIVELLSAQRFSLAELRRIRVAKGRAPHMFGRARWQLQANYRGTEVCLFSTTDALVFGQVRRALIRALEANQRRRVAAA